MVGFFDCQNKAMRSLHHERQISLSFTIESLTGQVAPYDVQMILASLKHLPMQVQEDELRACLEKGLEACLVKEIREMDVDRVIGGISNWRPEHSIY